MPDALSKTVPIWCAVMNRALFPEKSEYHAARFPPNFLPVSEESQIEDKIDGFVKSFKVHNLEELGQLVYANTVQDLKLDLDDLRQNLGKPILVSWANRAYYHPEDLFKDDEYNLFVLCSASKRVHGAEISEGGYIQGAGDDSEGWSHGLTPPVFWANKSTLFKTAEEDLPDMIGSLVDEHRKQGTGPQATLVAPTRNIYIGQTDTNINGKGHGLVIDCNGDPAASEGNPQRLNLGCARSKLGSRDLRKSLDKVQAFVSSRLVSDPSQSLLVSCESGKDLSAGVLLTVLCLFYDDNGILFLNLLPDCANDSTGEFSTSQTEKSVNKQFIRQRLAWIVSSKHDVNPSRATLQSANAFLMQRPDY